MDKLNLDKLRKVYYEITPEPGETSQKVSFGTSGHRGSPLNGTFNEKHISAISQAIADFRKENGITGPHFVGMDSHAVSLPAMMTALSVYAANGMKVFYEKRLEFDDKGGFTPTPAVSFAILEANKRELNSDGSIITPSHNPPTDGGFKYNPPSGGPADTATTKWIEERANKHLRDDNRGVKKMPFEQALKCEKLYKFDFIGPYVDALKEIIDIEAIKRSGISIGVDPMGGASLEYYASIKDRYGLNLTIVNPSIDMTFSFMPPDHDGKIRMDCSSPKAMANMIKLKDKYDISWGNDTDSDRHGIVTRSNGLLNPNHFLAVAIYYLLRHRPSWKSGLAVGKTVVSSSMIDKVVKYLKRDLLETPVGFKYFSDGFLKEKICFGGEESAGASFLKKDGSVWTTDKDGIIMGLLAAEILAVTGKDPGTIYEEQTKMFGTPVYERIDTPASPKMKERLKALSADQIKSKTLAGEKIISIMTKAPNGEPIGGLKVTAENGWFAARPSGTEDIAKLYAESFIGLDHLRDIQKEAQEIIRQATD